MTDEGRAAILYEYVECRITAEEAADALGPGTAIVDVILETRRRFGRLPDPRSELTEQEFRRALALLGLDAVVPGSGA